MGDSDWSFSSYFNTRTSYEKSSTHYTQITSPQFLMVENPDDPTNPHVMSVESWLETVFDHDPSMHFLDSVVDGERIHVVGRDSWNYVYLKVFLGSCPIAIYNGKREEIFIGSIKDAGIFLMKWGLSL